MMSLEERKRLAETMEQQAASLLHAVQRLRIEIAEEEAAATGAPPEQKRKPQRLPAKPDGPVSDIARQKAREALNRRGLVITRG